MNITGIVRSKLFIIALLITLIAVIPGEVLASSQDPDQEGNFVIIGQLLDEQDQPVEEAVVTAVTQDGEQIVAETESLEDGTWRLLLIEVPSGEMQITIEHPLQPTNREFKS